MWRTVFSTSFLRSSCCSSPCSTLSLLSCMVEDRGQLNQGSRPWIANIPSPPLPAQVGKPLRRSNSHVELV